MTMQMQPVRQSAPQLQISEPVGSQSQVALAHTLQTHRIPDFLPTKKVPLNQICYTSANEFYIAHILPFLKKQQEEHISQGRNAINPALFDIITKNPNIPRDVKHEIEKLYKDYEKCDAQTLYISFKEAISIHNPFISMPQFELARTKLAEEQQKKYRSWTVWPPLFASIATTIGSLVYNWQMFSWQVFAVLGLIAGFLFSRFALPKFFNLFDKDSKRLLEQEHADILSELQCYFDEKTLTKALPSHDDKYKFYGKLTNINKMALRSLIAINKTNRMYDLIGEGKSNNWYALNFKTTYIHPDFQQRMAVKQDKLLQALNDLLFGFSRYETTEETQMRLQSIYNIRNAIFFHHPLILAVASNNRELFHKILDNINH